MVQLDKNRLATPKQIGEMNMAKITTIGRAECRELSAELVPIIGEALAKYGLTAHGKSGRYEGHSAALTFEITVDALAEAKASHDADMLDANFGAGHTFVARGETYTVTGFDLRRRKYPVTAIKDSNGKLYKFAVEAVKRHVSNG